MAMPRCHNCMLVAMMLGSSVSNPIPADDDCSSQGTCSPLPEAGESMMQIRKIKSHQQMNEDIDAACRTLSTHWQHNGYEWKYPHGQTFWLDRHAANCNTLNGFGMSEFRIRTNHRTRKVQVVLKCCPIVGATEKVGAKRTSHHGGNRHDLSGLIHSSPVDCGEGYIIQDWKVTSGADVSFRCLKLTEGQNTQCHTKVTGAQRADGLNYLNRHHIKCNEGELLQSWDMEDAPDAGQTGRYAGFKYKCCRVTATTTTTTTTTTPVVTTQTLSGTLLNSATGDAVDKATVTIKIGTMVKETTTDDSGKWQISGVPTGAGTISYSKQGVISRKDNVPITPDMESIRASVSETLPPATWRIVLEWESKLNKDLDSHIYLGDCDLYFNKKKGICSGVNSTLDLDSHTGNKPETTTLQSLSSCTGKCEVTFKVKWYSSGAVNWTASDAKVKVYKGDHEEKEFAVIDRKGAFGKCTEAIGTKEMWAVFTLNGKTGLITPYTGDACEKPQ